MLTRLQLHKRNLGCIVRCLSDRSSDNNDKTFNATTEIRDVKKQTSGTSNKSSTEKIQELLKQMVAEPKISEKYYRDNFATAPEKPSKQKTAEIKTENEEEKLTKAAEEVAKVIGGDVKQTEAELLSKVLGKINQNSTSLSDLLIGMKVDRTKDTDDLTQKPSRGQQVKRVTERSQVRYTQRKESTTAPASTTTKKSLPQVSSVNIFGSEALGIFKSKEPNYGTQLPVWEALKQRELALATSQPPRNYFEKMILWTEQGKVWQFPINNEQGMEEEQNIHFSEHIFLDSLLEPWCPKRGPIRHFMELVCVGLSKNAFYTVKEKRDQINWYKQYFEEKKDLLTEVGAWETQTKNEAST